MEMTTCEYDGDIKSWNCQREEQCDDCFMVDHLKECAGCEHYEHRKLQVQHDTGERRFEAHVSAPWTRELRNPYFVELIADQEQKYGEYPLVQQGDE